MLINLRTYSRYVNYWSSYNGEVKLQLINTIVKGETWANTGIIGEAVKLYALYMIDGKKTYTDLAGFRKILKAARKAGVDLHVS
jgi:hypothetical protein